ncbi:MAG: sel1 repeat family protein [archaeon]|nr:sel1 repeat family protein [archaeon]
MSRAFTSEEYEAPEVVIDLTPEAEKSEDHDIVARYSTGRSPTDPELPREIGLHFLNGDEGFFRNVDLGVKWLKTAVRMGNVKAMTDLAETYLKDTRTFGYSDAAVLLRDAAEKGSEEARARLDMSTVTDPRGRRAFTTYRLNAELGSIPACLALAQGFEKDLYGKDKAKAAAHWYMRAFTLGDADAAKRVLALFYKKRIELSDEQLRKLRS